MTSFLSHCASYAPSVHYQPVASRAARGLNARAYTENSVVVAVDGSGSTYNSPGYWKVVNRELSGLTDEDTHFLVWGTDVRPLDRAGMKLYADAGDGREGGTYPSKLVETLGRGFRGELVLFTDGDVSRQEVLACERRLTDYGISFKRVRVFVTSNSSSSLDLSVVCPFIRKTQFRLEYQGPGMLEPEIVEGRSVGALDLDRVHTVAQFEAEFPEMRAHILANNLGKNNLQLKQDILAMRTRVIRSMAELEPDRQLDGVTQCVGFLESGEFESAKSAIVRVVNTYRFNTEGSGLSRINSMMDVLLRSCTSEGNYDMSIMARTAPTAPQPEVPYVPEQQTFGHECPILMSPDVPVVLVAKPDVPLFDALDKGQIDLIASNPLNVLRFPDLVARIKDHLDGISGMRFAAQYQHTTPHTTPNTTPDSSPRSSPGNSPRTSLASHTTSPFTRRPLIHGGLYLANSDEGVLATNWTLAQLTTGGKLLGCPALWGVVVWYLLASDKQRWGDACVDVANDHLKHRAFANRCKLGMSGMQNAVLVDCPLAVSLWYVVNSGDWFDSDSSLDRLRELWPVAGALTSALDVLGLAYDAEYITTRVAVYRAFHALMRSKESIADVQRAVRCQYQAHLKNGVFLDGPPSSVHVALPSYLSGLDLCAVVELVQLVADNVHKKPGAVAVPRTLGSAGVPAPKVNWGAAENDPNNHEALDICPATLRPYSTVGGVKWEVLSRAKYGVLEQEQISAYSLYIRYMQSKGAYPEDDPLDFAQYCLKNVMNREAHPKDTLPASFEIICEELFAGYARAYGSARPSVTDALEIMAKSMNRDQRLAMEQATGSMEQATESGNQGS